MFLRTGLRRIATYSENLAAQQQHARETAERWRKISLYIALPLVGLGTVNAWRLMKEHEEHMKHHPKEEHDYAYLNIRRKGFPWGDGSKSLFFNPAINTPKLP